VSQSETDNGLNGEYPIATDETDNNVYATLITTRDKQTSYSWLVYT